MSLETIVSQLLNLAGTFDFKILLALFLICLIGEAKLSVPFLLEAIWLAVGYQLGSGLLSPFQVTLIWLASQAGKQLGAIILYLVGILSSHGIRKLGKPLSLPEFFVKHFNRHFNRINLLSPFEVAFGRLIGLRFPITWALSAKRKLKILLLGVLISSIAWDGIYIALGAIFHKTSVKPLYIFMYTLLGVVAIYLTAALVRFLYARFARKTRVSA